ncbi:MAG: tetratricopeptide repeat protein [Massilia sp.]
MSLINKMLQDLDARGTPGAESMQVHVKPVAREERGLSIQVVIAAAVGALVIALAGGVGWRYLHQPVVKPAQPPALVVAPAPPVVAASRPAVVEPAASAPAVAGPVRPQPSAKAQTSVRKAMPHMKARLAAGNKDRTAGQKKARVADSRTARLAEKGEPGPARASRPAASAGGREESSAQRAEGAYRRGLASLQEGRTGEAIGALEQALQLEPKHDAARQTLVGLLIENKRNDDAIRQLQFGLTQDPRQPALAMLLARLQIEHGGSGIETLTRTLPYAAGNGDYHSFLAGALQRQQRHREAAEQYQAALRTQPQHGVWWMGLGISLQADKRNAEALDAFQKAQGTGTLSPELQAFVERKLGQLSR